MLARRNYEMHGRHFDDLRNALMLAVAGLALLSAQAVWSQPLVLIDDGQMYGFEEYASDKINRRTTYTWVLGDDGQTGMVLDAVAESSASGLVLEKRLPFSEQAEIEVTYKVVDGNNAFDEMTKQGDDFPLRIYFTNKNLIFYRSLVLVHSLQNNTGSYWRNPFSSYVADFYMYVIAGKQEGIGQWRTQSIGVGKAWKRVYGSVPDKLDAISLMVDSDNTDGRMQTRISKLVYRS